MKPPLQQFRVDTPLGPLTALCSSRGLRGLWFDDQRHHPGPLSAQACPEHPLRQTLLETLARYFGGECRSTQHLPLDPQGTPFQRQVWDKLLTIPSGGSLGYGELARALGRPAAARAVGAAVGRNPISILIPCHRVLGSGGELRGYAGGLARKTALLRLEGARFAKEARKA